MVEIVLLYLIIYHYYYIIMIIIFYYILLYLIISYHHVHQENNSPLLTTLRISPVGIVDMCGLGISLRGHFGTRLFEPTGLATRQRRNPCR